MPENDAFVLLVFVSGVRAWVMRFDATCPVCRGAVQSLRVPFWPRIVPTKPIYAQEAAEAAEALIKRKY